MKVVHGLKLKIETFPYRRYSTKPMQKCHFCHQKYQGKRDYSITVSCRIKFCLMHTDIKKHTYIVITRVTNVAQILLVVSCLYMLSLQTNHQILTLGRNNKLISVFFSLSLLALRSLNVIQL